MEKTIKHRLYTWFEDIPSPMGGDETVRVERIAHLGQTVDINDEASLQRGEELGSFFDDETAEAIKNGTYRGPVSDQVYRFRGGVQLSQLNDEDGSPGTQPDGSFDPESADSEEIGEYIRQNKLSVPSTIALVPADADTEMLEKFYDAETYATENDPRKGVTDHLDARLRAQAE